MKNIKPRIIDYIFMGLAVLCFLFTLIYGCVKLPQLPDLLPSHSVSAPMVIGFLVLVIMGPVLFFPQVWNNTQGIPAYKIPRVVRSTRTCISFLLFLTEAFFVYTLVCTVHSTPLHAFVSPLYMGLLFADTAWILIQTFRK